MHRRTALENSAPGRVRCFIFQLRDYLAHSIALVQNGQMAQSKTGAEIVAAQKCGITVEEYRQRTASGLKKCTRCKLWFPRGSFCRDSSRYDGLSAIGNCCRRVKVRKTTKGRVSTFKGKHHTEENKQRFSQLRKGKPCPWRKGAKHTLETRAKISAHGRLYYPRGEKHYNWKDGKTQRLLDARRQPQYADWRKAVFERDNYKCQDCGDARGGNLQAHHIRSFANHYELRFDVSNGVTVCQPCHDKRHYKADRIRNRRKLRRGERLWKWTA
jgi:hypothetical protein